MKNGYAMVTCKCKHEYQDQKYGNQQRVACATAKQDKDYVDVRCTVCSTIHRVHPNKVK